MNNTGTNIANAKSEKQQVLSNVNQFIPVSSSSQLKMLVKQFAIMLGSLLIFAIICICSELLFVKVFYAPPFIGSAVSIFVVIAIVICFALQDTAIMVTPKQEARQQRQGKV